MIRLDTNDQGDTAVFVLSFADRPRARLDCPRQVCVSIDRDDPRESPVESLRARWSVVAEMLTGFTPEEVAAEGVEVRKLDPATCQWVAR